MLLIPFALLIAWSAGATPNCGVYFDAPYGLKHTSALIMDDRYDRVRAGLERLDVFVRRARPERREVAEHVLRLVSEIEFMFDRNDADRVADSFLTYMMRSPRLAPGYLEAITSALFARFRREEPATYANRDLAPLEEALAFYLHVAAGRPKIVAAQFKSRLDAHLHEFVRDDVQRLYELGDALSARSDVSAASMNLARDVVRVATEVDSTRLDLPDASHPENTVLVFWLRLVARVARTLPKSFDHSLSRAAENVRGHLRDLDVAGARALVNELEFERIGAEVRDWQSGVAVEPHRRAAYRRWIYFGRPDFERYRNLLLSQTEALLDRDDFGYDLDDESEAAARARLAENFPDDSAAHRHLLEFAGPNVDQVERGSRALTVPAGLRAIVPDLPDRLRFSLAHHYDEHIWERAEVRRSIQGFLRRRLPEYVVDSFERLLSEIQAANQHPPGPRVRRTTLDQATLFLSRVKDGVARRDFETTVWSVPKRNQMLGLLGEAEWRVLDGQASNQNNVLLQATVKGTRFNLAVCVREPCSGNLRVGGVASIYPVCGPGVFLVPRASKIARTLERLKDPHPKANKDFREGLVKAKPCPE